MHRKSGKHARNTKGLKRSAQAKREKTIRRCEQALQKLLRERQPINFTAVARTAKISVAWLYKEPDVRSRIEELRGKFQPQKVFLPASERLSDAGLRAQNNALKLRNQQLTHEKKVMQERIAVAYGLIASHNLPVPD